MRLIRIRIRIQPPVHATARRVKHFRRTVAAAGGGCTLQVPDEWCCVRGWMCYDYIVVSDQPTTQSTGIFYNSGDTKWHVLMR